VSWTESTRAQEVENVTVQASVWEDVEGLVCKVALLEGELAKVRQVQEVAEDKFHSLYDTSAHGAWRLVVSEMECQEQFEEHSLLRAWGVELCLAIVGPSQVRSHLSARMQVTAICQTEMVGELATL
jgi:hypothetical protein